MFLGIDQSLTGTGICALLGHDVYETQLIRPKQLRGAERLLFIARQITEFIAQKGGPEAFTLAAIEGYAFGATGKVFQLGEVGGVVRLVLRQHEVPFIVVGPQKLKKWITGSGGGSKGVIMAHLRDKFGIMFADDNEADAYGLALLAAHFAGMWEDIATSKKLQQARREVITSIRKDPEGLLSERQKARILLKEVEV